MSDFNNTSGQTPYTNETPGNNGYDGQPGNTQYAQPQQAQTQYENPNAYAQPQYSQESYSGQQQYAGPQYGQQQYGSPYTQNPNGQQYQQPQYQQPQYGQPPYGQPSGYEYQQIPVGYVPRQKIVAGLLGIFLGSLGVHNFYLGYTSKAVAQLLLTCVGWIFFGLGPAAAAIWSLIEAILILCSNYGSPWHRDGRGVELRD